MLLLPSMEYAAAALIVAYSAVSTTALYMPFARYSLVADEHVELQSDFWTVQPFAISTILMIAIFLCATVRDVTIGAAMAGAVFSCSQGLKLFVGEQSRANGELSRLRDLYVYDAITTLILCLTVLLFVRTGIAYVLATAASSLYWSTRRSDILQMAKPTNKGFFTRLRLMYRYSYGPVGASSLNSGTVAMARTALVVSAPPAIAGAVQFLLDMTQKAGALVASSITTAAVPEVAKGASATRTMDKVVTMTAVLGAALIGGSVLLALALSLFRSDGEQVSLGVAVLIGAFVWANRYRSTALELALLTSIKFSSLLIAGALASFTAMLYISFQPLDLRSVLVASTGALLGGGVVSIAISLKCGLIEYRSAALALGVASLVLAGALVITT